jgi:transposase
MFVGLDVHKDTIDVSIAEGDRRGEVRHDGVIASDLEPVNRVVRALRAPDRTLQFVYEAGPCGFGIYRHLIQRGEVCLVVSPSVIPKRSGDRVKTDRRDSLALARLHRAGELRAISVPNDTDEAMRDLVRARADAVAVSIQAKYRLKAFLLRQGRRSPGRDGWTLAYRRGLTDLPLSEPPAAHRLARVSRHHRRNGTTDRAAHRAAAPVRTNVALGARGCGPAGPVSTITARIDNATVRLAAFRRTPPSERDQKRGTRSEQAGFAGKNAGDSRNDPRGARYEEPVSA